MRRRPESIGWFAALVSVLRWAVIVLVVYLEWADATPMLSRPPAPSAASPIVLRDIQTVPGDQRAVAVGRFGRADSTTGTFTVCDRAQEQ